MHMVRRPYSKMFLLLLYSWSCFVNLWVTNWIHLPMKAMNGSKKTTTEYKQIFLLSIQKKLVLYTERKA